MLFLTLPSPSWDPRSGERQVRKLRQKFFDSILCQDISWFDGFKSGEVLTRLSADTELIQDGISEKCGQCLQFLANFVAAMVKCARTHISLWVLRNRPIISNEKGACTLFSPSPPAPFLHPCRRLLSIVGG